MTTNTSPALRGDLHVHSSYSCDVPKLPDFAPRALYDRAVASGMGVFTLTDHDTLAGFEALRSSLQAEFGDRPPIEIVSGVELKIRDPEVGHTIHVNVLGLDSVQLEELKRRSRSVEHFLAYCREQHLFHVYNHPFWFEPGEKPNFAAIERVVARFPVVELNAGRIVELNNRTSRLAARCGKQLVAASDTHTGQVGKSFTMAPGTNVQEFLASIISGKGEPVASHLDFRGFMAEISQTVDLFLHGAATRTNRRVLPVVRNGRAARITQRVVESRLLWRTSLQRKGLGILLKLGIRAPAYQFIRKQRRMLPQVSEGC